MVNALGLVRHRGAAIASMCLLLGVLATGCTGVSVTQSYRSPATGAQPAASRPNPPAPAGAVQPVAAASPVVVAPSAAAPATASSDATGRASATEIVVGTALPLTGAEAVAGNAQKDAYEFAVKQVNAQGGLKIGDRRLPVRLIIDDNKNEPDTSANLYEKLATEDKVDFFLGTFNTANVVVDSRVAFKYQIPYVTGGGAASEIFNRGFRYVFGVQASIVNLAVTTMSWLREQQDAGKLPKKLRVALLWENTAHGKDYQTGVLQEARKSPDRFEVVIDESFVPKTEDYAPLLGRVMAASSDVMLVDPRLEDAIQMHKQFVELGMKQKVVSYGPRGTEKQIREQLGDDANYLVSVGWWSPDLPYPQVKEFVAAWQKEYSGQAPSWYAANGYEAAQTLFEAIEKAGAIDQRKVRDALAGIDRKSMYPGQKLKFNADGQADTPLLIQQNTPDGKFKIIYPKDAAGAEAIVPIPGS